MGLMNTAMLSVRVLLYAFMGLLSMWVGDDLQEQALLFSYTAVLGLLAEGMINLWLQMKAYAYASDKIAEQLSKTLGIFERIAGDLAKIHSLEVQRSRGNRMMR